jgi:hypothetical protein
MVVSLAELWLPILLSAVAVFVVSSIIHMAVPIHKGDWKKLPSEESLLAAIRAQNVPPGMYMFPHCGSMKDMGSPETLERFRQGPVGYAVLRPSGAPAMGKALVQWFLYSVLISVFVAYLGTLSLDRGAGCSKVFQVTGTAGILAYGVNCISDSIWKSVPWGVSLKFVFDGVLYGLATGAVFCWMWPAAAA